jgi:hypothetical protein
MFKYSSFFFVPAQDKLAADIYDALPFATRTYLESDRWKGGALLDLSQSRMIRTPTSREIVANYHWLIAIVRASPQKDISFKQFS